jgi:hypothetical protein
MREQWLKTSQALEEPGKRKRYRSAISTSNEIHICERNLKAYLFTLVMVFFDPRSKEQKDVS